LGGQSTDQAVMIVARGEGDVVITAAPTARCSVGGLRRQRSKMDDESRVDRQRVARARYMEPVKEDAHPQEENRASLIYHSRLSTCMAWMIIRLSGTLGTGQAGTHPHTHTPTHTDTHT